MILKKQIISIEYHFSLRPTEKTGGVPGTELLPNSTLLLRTVMVLNLEAMAVFVNLTCIQTCAA